MEKKEYSIEQQAAKVVGGLEQVDQMRTEGYEMALDLHGTRVSAQQRERNRLVAKYGEKHERVKRMDRKLSNGNLRAKGLRVQQTRAKNKIPELQSGHWQVYGMVVDKENNPLEGLSVSLFNANGGWERQFGYACTDAEGYFHILVTSPELIAKAKGQNYTLTVTDSSQKVVLRDKTPIQVAADKSELRRLVVDPAHCSPPEAPRESSPDGPQPPMEPPKDPKAYVVWGIVKNQRGQAMPGVQVRVVANTPDGDCDLGKEVVTDSEGRYKVAYTLSDFDGEKYEIKHPDITVSVFDSAGKRLESGKSRRRVPRVARLDVTVCKRWLNW